MLKRRDIYLKIEKLPGYSPVAPDDAEHDKYRLDCMRGEGHEGGRIPDSEVEMRRIDALVYREYLDPLYTVPNTAKMVAADINEPRWERRIPGAFLYAVPGERLFIHVLNEDEEPHSFHMHGLHYGIDSDGSYPFGLANKDGQRSDEICPGDSWSYVFDVTRDTIGVWPFHDHYRNIMDTANRGLFGGLVVRDPECEKPDLEVPFFLHRLAGTRNNSLFDSGTLNNAGTFDYSFIAAGSYDYMCRFHPMSGKVVVAAGEPPSASVQILGGPPRFDPAEVRVAPGGAVHWVNNDAMVHTVTESGGSGQVSYCINGRSFVGNTPTIVAETGKKIRWYVFNLDLELWHNFHPHSQRWRWSDEIVDTRSLGPAESFRADTQVPPVILSYENWYGKDYGPRTPLGHKLHHHGGHGAAGGAQHGHGATGHAGHAAARLIQPMRPHHPGHDEEDKDCVRLRGDFLVHCHVEMHMMQGMSALVRAIQNVKDPEELEKESGVLLPKAKDLPECPDVDPGRCRKSDSGGTWATLPDLPIFVVHAALLTTGRVLLWSGTAEVGHPLESRVWNPADGTLAAQTYAVDLFCAGQTFLPDGRLLIGGGAPQGALNSTHIFNPTGETWTRIADMNAARWYPTIVPLPDGRALAVSGSGVSSVEVFDPATGNWTGVAGATRSFPELYPSLHVIPSGEIFYTRCGWAVADTINRQTGYLRLTGPASGSWVNLAQQQFTDREEGTAVMMIDTTVSPESAKIVVIGGGVTGGPINTNPQSVEMIDVSTLTPAPAWQRLADMNFRRTNVNAVLLPDGNILVIGGQRAGKWAADPQPVLEGEVYDPATNTWAVTAPMQFPRQYHSIAVLLPDGRVLSAGGVDPANPIDRDQRSAEVFSPAYLFRGPRPTIASAPATVAFGSAFSVNTPDAARIDSVVLLRTIATTHHTDAGQRYVKLRISSRTASQLTAQAPGNGNIAPPGFYLLFIVANNGVPSIGNFIRLG